MNPQQLALQRLQQNNQTLSPMQATPSAMAQQSDAALQSNTLNSPWPSDISREQNAAMQLAQDNQPKQTATQGASQSTNSSTTGSVDYNQLEKKGFSPTQIESYLSSNPGVTLQNAPTNWDASIKQDTIIPKAAPITETFGEKQGIEVFSHGITTGTGIGVPAGTPLATPPGKWKVVESYDQAPQKGFIGNAAGEGWGNNIVIKNEATGEELRYSHLSQVGVAQGDEISGKRVIGLSGQSGNTTGDHLNIQYITPKGVPADILGSSYAKYLPISN